MSAVQFARSYSAVRDKLRKRNGKVRPVAAAAARADLAKLADQFDAVDEAKFRAFCVKALAHCDRLLGSDAESARGIVEAAAAALQYASEQRATLSLEPVDPMLEVIDCYRWAIHGYESARPELAASLSAELGETLFDLGYFAEADTFLDSAVRRLAAARGASGGGAAQVSARLLDKILRCAVEARAYGYACKVVRRQLRVCLTGAQPISGAPDVAPTAPASAAGSGGSSGSGGGGSGDTADLERLATAAMASGELCTSSLRQMAREAVVTAVLLYLLRRHWRKVRVILCAAFPQRESQRHSHGHLMDLLQKCLQEGADEDEWELLLEPLCSGMCTPLQVELLLLLDREFRAPGGVHLEHMPASLLAHRHTEDRGGSDALPILPLSVDSLATDELQPSSAVFAAARRTSVDLGAD